MNRIDKKHPIGLLSAALGAVVLVAYWPLLRAQFIGLDDPDYVTVNSHVLNGLSGKNVAWAFRTGAAANWHPLTWLSHMLDVELFGLNPAGHHFTSVLFHIANSLLVLFVFRSFTGALWRSLLVAALFALHPLHVESVAWIAERKDVLSTFFFLLTLWAYGRYAHPEPNVPGSADQDGTEAGSKVERDAADPAGSKGKSGPAAPSRPTTKGHSRAFYCLALGLFALGLMSKPMLVTLPFVLLLLDLWPLNRAAPLAFSRRLWPLLLEKVPFFLLGAASSVVTFLVQEKGHATTAVLPLAPRLANAVVSYCKYLGKTVWPLDLAAFYPHPDIRYPVSHQWPGWEILLAAMALAAVSIGVCLRVRRAPWLAVGWFWYLGTLVPVIGIVQVGGQGMADRYTYIPLIGIFLCAAWGLGALVSARPSALTAATLSSGLVITGCLALTERQLGFWQNDFNLFTHALAVTTHNVVAEVQVGTGLRERGRLDEAAAHFRAAIEAAPANGRGYHGLGLTLAAQGKFNEAIAAFQQALKVAPWDEQAHHDLGLTLWALGRRDEAQAEYLEALRLRPDFAEAHISLATALSARGDLEGAAASFTRAIASRPGDADPLARLAELRIKQGRLPEAEACFRQWVRSHPASAQARVNLGGVLWRQGRLPDALTEYTQAVRLDPDLPMARFDLATALFAQGNLPEAAAQFDAAVHLKPDYIEAYVGLGRVMIGLSQFDRAVEPFAQATRLCPTNSDLPLYWGTALMMAGKTNEASAPFEAALRLDPNLEQETLDSGKALAAQGKTNAALARFNTALWLRPTDPEAHENLGLLLQQQGKAAEADLHLREAARLRGRGKPRP